MATAVGVGAIVAENRSMHIVIVAIGHVVCIEPLLCSLGPRGRTTILCELAFPSSHRNGELLIVEVGATSMFAPLLPAFAEYRNATDEHPDRSSAGL